MAGGKDKPKRSEIVKISLTPAEREAAERAAGPIPLATWVYALVIRELEKAADK